MKLAFANQKEFEASLKRVVLVTKREESDVVNKALKDVAFRAASFTPKATAAKIMASLTTKQLAGVAAQSLKRKQGYFSRPEHRREMRRIANARKRGIGALRAGWIPAIQALGGSYRGAKLRAGGTAAKGIAKRATIKELAGMIVNRVVTKDRKGRAYSADEIAVARQALDKAIQFVASDRNAYAKRKIDAALKRLSD